MKKVKKILISQPRPLSDRNPYADMTTDYGVECDFQQLIKVEGIGVREFREQHIYLEEYTAIIVNSRLGIDHYFRMADETVNVLDDYYYEDVFTRWTSYVFDDQPLNVNF